MSVTSKRMFWSVFAAGALTGVAITVSLRPGDLNAANPNTTNQGNIADLYTAIRVLQADIATLKGQQALDDKVVRKLSPLENEAGEIVAFGPQAWHGEQAFHTDSVNVLEGLSPAAIVNGRDAEGTREIIAILRCPEEPGARSLSVNGLAEFRNPENGAFAQFNNCQNPAAPTLEIGVRDFAAVLPTDHPGLVVRGPAGPDPLVEFTALEPVLPRDVYGPVGRFNPYQIPDLPMPSAPNGLEVQGRVSLLGRDAQADFSPEALEFTSRLTGAKSCLTAIELLVRCGQPGLSPAGIHWDPETGVARLSGDRAEVGELSSGEAFINDLTVRTLIELMPTDDPF